MKEKFALTSEYFNPVLKSLDTFYTMSDDIENLNYKEDIDELVDDIKAAWGNKEKFVWVNLSVMRTLAEMGIFGEVE
jgi:hypothetical protein